MLKSKMVRFSAVALIGIACVLATEARADFLGPITLPAPALTASLGCTADVDGEGGTLIVTAGPDGLAVPHDVTSLTTPSCPTGTTCSEYTYRFANSNSNISNAWLSISSDIVIYQATITSPTPSPGGVFIGECLADKTPTNGLIVCAQREVRFSPEVGIPQMDVKVVVSRSAPRIATVGAFFGPYHSGFCPIQGPGVPGGAFTPFTSKKTDTIAGGKCTVDVAPDANNKITRKEQITNPIGCDQFDLDLSVNGSPFQDSQNKPITAGTGTYTCYPTTPKASCYCVRGTVCP